MIDAIAIFLVVMGLLFFLGASVGLLRFPDFYSRMHAAGKGDTLSSVLVLLGVAVSFAAHQHHYSVGTVLVVLKILLIVLFIFVGSPTATHAIMHAGYRTGVKHWDKKTDTEVETKS